MLAKFALAMRPKQPWKNGGGLSTDLAVEPPDAGWTDSLWRVAVAEITASAPFSQFPGYDRQFVALGPGLTLMINGEEHAAGSFEVVTFPGDAATSCRLDATVKRPLQAFNLILRRDAAQGSVGCHPGAVRLVAPSQGVLVLFVARGGFSVSEAGGKPITLDADEALLHHTATPLAVEPYKPWSLLLSAAVAPRPG